MTRFAIAFAATALVLAASPAAAQEYRIRFGDLDLASPADAARFDRRVRRAARAACVTGAPLADAHCIARFRAEAMDGLPAARRDDYVRARSGRIMAMVPTIYG